VCVSLGVPVSVSRYSIIIRKQGLAQAAYPELHGAILPYIGHVASWASPLFPGDVFQVKPYSSKMKTMRFAMSADRYVRVS
jgi:hypothetical protein